jgi:type IV secretory pathway VirB2 component (pilin)
MILTCSICAADETWTAGSAFWIDKVSNDLQNGGNDLVGTVNNILWYIIGLFYFIAVAFGIYAGFTILTWAGEEEKMKKWKNILIYVIVGLVVIFLASQIVSWVVVTLSDTSIVG